MYTSEYKPDSLSCMTKEELEQNRLAVEQLKPGEKWAFLFVFELDSAEVGFVISYLKRDLDVEYEESPETWEKSDSKIVFIKNMRFGNSKGPKIKLV